MTLELLNKIAKAKKINLEHFDHVAASINEAYTWILVDFFNAEILPGGQFRRCNVKSVKLSVSSILKREEELPEDYETAMAWRGEWLFNIK